MPTRDPHIALIDAHEALHAIRMKTRAAVIALQEKVRQGYKMTEEDKQQLAVFRQQAIDATRRVQERLYEEIESHHRQTPVTN